MTDMRRSMFSLFGSRRFWPLFAVQAIAAFSDNLLKNALIFLVTYRGLRLGDVPAGHLVAAAAALFVLPFFLFSAPAGQWADRFARSRMTRWSRAAEIGVAGLATLALWRGDGAFLFAVLALMGLQAAVYSPLKYGIVPDLLQGDDLIAANAWIEGSTFVAILLGTVAGGLLVLLPDGRLWVGAALVVLAAIGWLCSLAIPQTRAAAPGLRIGWNVPMEIARLLRLAARDGDIFRAILGVSWFWFLGSLFLVLFPVYVRDTLRGSAPVATFLMTVFSLGVLAGSLACGKFLRRRGGLWPAGWAGLMIFALTLHLATAAPPPSAAGPLGIADLLASPAGWQIIADLAGIAAAGGVFSLPFYVRIQQRSPEALRARYISANNVVNALAMVLASVTISVMTAMGFGPLAVFATGAAGTLIAGWGVTYRERAFREGAITPPAPRPESD